MLDGAVRRLIEPGLDRLGAAIAKRGVSADQVTLSFLRSASLIAGAITQNHICSGSLDPREPALRRADGAVPVASLEEPTGAQGAAASPISCRTLPSYGIIPLSLRHRRARGQRGRRAVLLRSFLLTARVFSPSGDGGEAKTSNRGTRGEIASISPAGWRRPTETIGAFCLIGSFSREFCADRLCVRSADVVYGDSADRAGGKVFR